WKLGRVAGSVVEAYPGCRHRRINRMRRNRRRSQPTLSVRFVREEPVFADQHVRLTECDGPSLVYQVIPGERGPLHLRPAPEGPRYCHPSYLPAPPLLYSMEPTTPALPRVPKRLRFPPREVRAG